MSTPQKQTAQAMIIRLAEMTAAGMLPWDPIYGDLEGDEHFDHRAATRPAAYELNDDVHGFGIMRLVVGGEDDPCDLYASGRIVPAEHEDLDVLLATIREQHERIQGGELLGPLERVQRVIESAVGPYAEQLEHASAITAQQTKLVESLTGTVSRLVTVLERLVPEPQHALAAKLSRALGDIIEGDPPHPDVLLTIANRVLQTPI